MNTAEMELNREIVSEVRDCPKMNLKTQEKTVAPVEPTSSIPTLNGEVLRGLR